MTTLLPVNLSSFGHTSSKSQQLVNRHLASSKALPIKASPGSYSAFRASSHLTFSASGAFSISLPVLCLTDRGFGLKSPTSVPSTSVPASALELPLQVSGSLPDLYTMVSGSTTAAAVTSEQPGVYNGQHLLRDRASSLNAGATAAAKPEEPKQVQTCFLSGISSEPLSSALFQSSGTQPETAVAVAADNNDSAHEVAHSITSTMPSSTSPTSTPAPRRRKNSSMTPVMPDLELMAKLQAEEDEQKKKKEAVLVNGACTAADAEPAVSRKDEQQPILDPRKEWQLFGTGSEKESAAAWLAAATKRSSSPQTSRRKNGTTSCSTEAQLTSTGAFPSPPTLSKPAPAIVTSINSPFYSGIDSSTAQYKIPASSNCAAAAATPPASPKPLQPFGKNDRVRRTSILRPPASFVATSSTSCASVSARKKKVSFADTAGKALEIVRYFAVPPVPNRRYSSYTAPTPDAYLLSNGNYNSPWNMAITGNSGTGSSRSLGTASSTVAVAPAFNQQSLNTSVSLSSVSREYDYSQHIKLAPRYELVACNFTSPSLQLSFGSRLEAQSVLLHSVTTAETTVYGTVSVMNRHFTKRVQVRYTFNEWTTYVEREATYMLGSHDGRTDKFSFVIYARPEDFGTSSSLATTFNLAASGSGSSSSTHPRLYFALCFSTGDGRTFWDNNDGRNYCLNLTAY